VAASRFRPDYRGGGLEVRVASAYPSAMDDTPHHSRPADWEPPMPSEAELIAALDESEADIAAGRVVSGEEVLRELRESIARMEATMDDTPHHSRPADWEPPMPSEAELLAALDESLAELAAGVPTVPDEVVRQGLLDSIARIEAKRAGQRDPTPRR
jgi:predicted transcriptional regulator